MYSVYLKIYHGKEERKEKKRKKTHVLQLIGQQERLKLLHPGQSRQQSRLRYEKQSS